MRDKNLVYFQFDLNLGLILHSYKDRKLIFPEVMCDQYSIDIFKALSEVGLGDEMLTFVFQQYVRTGRTPMRCTNVRRVHG